MKIVYDNNSKEKNKMLKSLARARKYPTLDDVPNSDLHLFATDHIYPNVKDPTKVSKQFFRMNYIEFFERLFVTPANQRTFYEYVNTPKRKIYFDIEWEFLVENYDVVLPQFNQIRDCTLTGIQTELHSKNVNYNVERDCIIQSSHGPGKLSLHIIINNFYFDRLDNLQYFVAAVRNYIPRKLWYYIKPNKGTPSDKRSPSPGPVKGLGETLDTRVYTTGRQFRLVWNTKLGKNRFLIIDPITPIGATFPRQPGDPDNISEELQKLRLFEACMITFTSNCTLLPDWAPIEDAKVAKYAPIQLTNAQDQFMIDAFTSSTYSTIFRLGNRYRDNSYYLVPINKPWYCDGHQRNHDNNNALLCYGNNNTVFIRCFAGGSGGIMYITTHDHDDTEDNFDDDDTTNNDVIGNLDCGDYYVTPSGDTIWKTQQTQRVQAHPIINGVITHQNLEILVHKGNNEGVLPTTTFDCFGQPIETNKTTVGSTLSHYEGQLQIPTATTTIDSFLEGNINFIGGNEYNVQDLYDAYERYRNGRGTKYNYSQGHFGRELNKLGHIVERRGKGGKDKIIRLKLPERPFTNTNPVEILNNLAANANNLLLHAQQREVTEPTVVAKRPLDKHTDIMNFMDDYLTPDPEAKVDLDNLYLCFIEYCDLNNIKLMRFGKGRLTQFFRQWLSRDVDVLVLNGYKCKQDKIGAANRMKEYNLRKIWHWNNTQYHIGWHNDRDKDRYCKEHLPEWSNIRVIRCMNQVVPDIVKLINLTESYKNSLTDRIKDIQKEIDRLTFRQYADEVDNGPRINDLSESIREELEEIRRNVEWCIAVRSTFATQKTVNLFPYIQHMIETNPNFKVLIILPRITLTTEYISVYQGLGFNIYTDNNTENGEIRGDRLIVCYPSIHRVRGQFDLTVLDEYKVIKDLQHTLVVKNNKEAQCYNALKCYIRDTPRVYIADALLTNAHVLEISKLRNNTNENNGRLVTVYQNFYKKHYENIVWTVDNKELLVHHVVHRLKNGERVAVPVNSKSFAEFVEYLVKLVTTELPNLEMSIITADNRADRPVQELWHGKQLIIYTPTILAGNSYTEPVDAVFGYCTPESCDQGDYMQMLMRCRNIISKSYYICVDNRPAKRIIPDDIPVTFNSIKTYLLDRDVIMRLQSPNIPEEYRLPIGMLEFNPVMETIKAQDPAFDSYVNHIKQNVVKHREYLFRMLLYMRDCGFSYGGNIYTTTDDKQFVMDIKHTRSDFMKDRKASEIEKQHKASEIITFEYNELSKKTVKTKDDIYKIKKYRLRHHYKVDNTPKWFIKATKGHHQQYSNLVKFLQLNGVTNNTERYDLMGTIGNEILSNHDKEDFDIFDDIKQRNIEIEIQTCFHALNVLGLIGAHEHIRNHAQYYVSSAANVIPVLEEYFKKFRDKINIILVGKWDDNSIKIGSMITDKAFGIKFRDHQGIILVKNMWISNDSHIWPINLELYDREELVPLPDYTVLNERYDIRKHQEWLDNTATKLTAWNQDVINRLFY